jgi:hypothetical protein
MTKYEQMVEELQQRVDMLHVLAGIEVSDEARGFAIGTLQAALAGLDRAAEIVVQASGLSEEEWRTFHDTERERQRREWRREWRKKQRGQHD